jgi:hypothetical protein
VRTLAALHVPATFFLIGQHVAPFRETVALEARDNAVGDHTFHHVQLTALSLVDAGHEIENTAKAITGITHQPVRLLRPPLGSRNPGVDASRARACSVLWDIDVRHPGCDGEGVAAVNHHAQPGSSSSCTRRPDPGLAAGHRRRGTDQAPAAVTIQLMALDPPGPRRLEAGPRGCGLPIRKRAEVCPASSAGKEEGCEYLRFTVNERGETLRLALYGLDSGAPRLDDELVRVRARTGPVVSTSAGSVHGLSGLRLILRAHARAQQEGRRAHGHAAAPSAASSAS